MVSIYKMLGWSFESNPGRLQTLKDIEIEKDLIELAKSNSLKLR